MDKLSLDLTVREHLEEAARATSGRSSATVFGGHEKVLRQTLIAARGVSMDEHENPGEATVRVLRGRVVLDQRHYVPGRPGTDCR